MIYEYKGIKPLIHSSAFVHPQACVIGEVSIGKDVYIGPFATVRGDYGSIEIRDGSNVQENCTIHMFPGVKVLLEEESHIGHGAIIHGAHIGKNVMVGMNAVVMDEVHVGDNSIVGALTLITQGKKIPKRSMVVGNPGKVVKELDDEMIEWKRKGTQLYQQLPQELRDSMKEIEPLSKFRHFNPGEHTDYSIWQREKKAKKRG